MWTSDRIMGIVAGVLMILGGGTTLISEFPTASVRGIITISDVRWFGFPVVIGGIAFIITSIRGLYIDRKNRLAAIARCAAERQREKEHAQGDENQNQ